MGTIGRLSFAIALAAASAAAQVRETTTVEVVEVPVYVTAKGAPIIGLTKDNFELYINGKRQTIDYFDTTDYANLSSEQSHDVRQRRLYMLVFDMLSPSNALQHAQKAALQFVENSASNDTIGVASFGAGGFQIVVPFSRDHEVVERGISKLEMPAFNDPLHLAIPPAERGGNPAGWDGRILDPLTDPRLQDPMVRATAFAEDEISYLTDLADRLAGMEGQKHVVLLSAGFESMVIHGIDHSRAPGDIRSRSLVNENPRSGVPHANMKLIWEMEGLHLAYASAGVFLDAIDIGGLRMFQDALSNDSLYEFVDATGGRVIDHNNDLPGAMKKLSDLSRVVYILGFNAPNTGKTENKIALKLVNVPRGTQASYRRIYETGGAQIDTGDMLHLADIIQNDIEQNGVTTVVTAEPVDKGLDVEVDLPGREMLAHAGGGIIGAKIMMYVMSGKKVLAFKQKRLDIEVKKAEEGLTEGQPVRVRDTFELPPGNYSAKVVVRMDTTGALGYARADVVIPSAQ